MVNQRTKLAIRLHHNGSILGTLRGSQTPEAVGPAGRDTGPGDRFDGSQISGATTVIPDLMDPAGKTPQELFCLFNLWIFCWMSYRKIDHFMGLLMVGWLVVWNIFYLFIYWECHQAN